MDSLPKLTTDTALVTPVVMTLSLTEHHFIQQGIAQNIRGDGRGRLDYRPFSIETGVVPNANGSARLLLDGTHILVAVNVAIGEPLASAPTQGQILCSVQCSTSASLDVGGREERNVNVELSSGLQRVITHSKSIDLNKLGLIEGQQCWNIYVDAMVLDSTGNNLDAVVLATKAALHATTLPSVKIIPGESKDEKSTIEVSDDPFDVTRFDDSLVPISVSLLKV